MNNLPKTYIYPGMVRVSKSAHVYDTVLGSCVSICLWDKKLKIGSMNHFMLPFWNGKGLASPRYGNIAIPQMIYEMNALGSHTENIQAKIFGGAKILSVENTNLMVGDRNIDIAHKILEENKINVLKESVGGVRGRKILFRTDTFEIYMKYIEKKIL